MVAAVFTVGIVYEPDLQIWYGILANIDHSKLRVDAAIVAVEESDLSDARLFWPVHDSLAQIDQAKLNAFPFPNPVDYSETQAVQLGDHTGQWRDDKAAAFFRKEQWRHSNSLESTTGTSQQRKIQTIDIISVFWLHPKRDANSEIRACSPIGFWRVCSCTGII